MRNDIPTKNPAKLKEWLDGLPAGEKGRAFEQVLAELYRGNGWLVSIQGQRGDEGADILLFHPKTPHSVSLIVQAKNHAKPLTQDQTRIELIKFEQQAALRHKCQQFRLVAVNGYVADATKFGAFNLLLDSWDHVTALLKNYSPDSKKLPDIELFAHNRATYEEVVRLWQENDQVAVVQATGTGKSFVIAKVMSDFHGKQKIVLAPSYYILDQQKGKAPWLNDKTTYWTYAGLARKSEAQIKALKCSLIVLDEFHRCGADIWGKGVQRLLDSHPKAKILGTSATPIRYLDESRDMSEELFDGIVAVDLSLAEAIVKRILPAPTYISALYTLDEEIKAVQEEIDGSKRSAEEKAQFKQETEELKVNWEKTLGVPEILKKYLPADINKLIVFCKDQEHLDQMESEADKWFQKAGTHRWREKYRVLSAYPDSKKNLERFKAAETKDTVHLLFAIDMLNEGLHIPEVGAVILLRPTESPNIFYQQIGRCIEVGSNHEPIIFDLVNNLQSIRANDFSNGLLEAEATENNKRKELGLDSYAPVVKIEDLSHEIEEVLANIRDRLVSWEVLFEALVAFKEINGHVNVPQDYYENHSLGVWVSNQRSLNSKGRLSEERKQRLEKIGIIWAPRVTYWYEMYEHLQSYKMNHGHCNVPQDSKDYPELGQWVSGQRRNLLKGNAEEERKSKLDELGFNWDAREAKWEELFKQLADYREIRGHCNVPQIYKKNPSLSYWVSFQRVFYRNGKLSAARIYKLENLGFKWNVRDATWEEMFVALCSFKKENGHCNVVKDYADNPSLGTWVDRQRSVWKAGKMPEDKVRRLEDIGFVLQPAEFEWEMNYKALKAFIEEKGHCKVPSDYPDNPSLGRWVNRQKQARRKGNISEEKIQRLDALGFIWHYRDELWLTMYGKLKNFRDSNGHCNVPTKYEADSELARWINKQRSRMKLGKLSADRMRRLEKLNFEWRREL